MAADPALPPTLLGWMVRGEWRANPVRTLVAVLAIAVGVALGFAVHLVNRSALAEFDMAVRTVSDSADIRIEAVTPTGFDEALYPRIARLPGLVAVSPVIEIAARTTAGDPLTVIGLDPLRAARVTPALAAAAGPGSLQGGKRQVGLKLTQCRPELPIPCLPQAQAMRQGIPAGVTPALAEANRQRSNGGRL